MKICLVYVDISIVSLGSALQRTLPARDGGQKSCCVRGDDGLGMHSKEDVYIQVVSVEYGSSRPKLVPIKVKTESVDPTTMTLAVQVQDIAVLCRGRPDLVTCFFVGDPEYKNVLDLADFKLLQRELMHWELHPSDVARCFELRGPPTRSSSGVRARRRLPCFDYYVGAPSSWLEAHASFN